MTGASWRMFLGLALPASLQRNLSEFGAGFRPRLRGWRIVAPSALHVTVRFLGGVGRARVAELVSELSRIARPVPPFALEIRGCGIFPGRGRPRIFWCGVSGDLEALRRLGERCESWARDQGFTPNERPFTPHVTIARAGRDAERPRAAQCTPAVASEPWVVDRLSLFRSLSDEAGTRYVVVSESRFASASGPA